MIISILQNTIQVPPKRIPFKLIITTDAHSMGNQMDIVSDPEIKSFFLGSKRLTTIV